MSINEYLLTHRHAGSSLAMQNPVWLLLFLLGCFLLIWWIGFSYQRSQNRHNKNLALAVFYVDGKFYGSLVMLCPNALGMCETVSYYETCESFETPAEAAIAIEHTFPNIPKL